MKSCVNRYGTRLFVIMCVCKSVLSAHPTTLPNERCPCCQQAKNKPFLTPLGVRKAVIPMYSKRPNENGQKSLYQSRNGFIDINTLDLSGIPAFQCF